MKLKRCDVLRYECDICHKYKKYKDMHNDEICSDCEKHMMESFEGY